MFCSRYSGAVSVASTLSRATEAPERLNRDRVIDVAEEIVAARGVRGLNMRALAEAVGVGTTSLYRHVRAKEDVLGALANRKLAQLELPAEGALAWEDELGAIFGALRQSALANPELVEITARQHVNGPATYEAAERALRALTKAGLDLETAANAFGTMSAFTFGFVQQELHSEARHAQMAERLVAVSALPASDYPLVRGSVTAFLNRDSERNFGLGLDLLLRGIAAVGNRS